MELKPQVLWNERERRVLGSSNLVSRVLDNGVTLFQHVIGERQVEVKLTVILVVLVAVIGLGGGISSRLNVLVILTIIAVRVLLWSTGTTSSAAALLAGAGRRPVVLHAIEQRLAFCRAALDRHPAGSPSRPLRLGQLRFGTGAAFSWRRRRRRRYGVAHCGCDVAGNCPFSREWPARSGIGSLGVKNE